MIQKVLNYDFLYAGEITSKNVHRQPVPIFTLTEDFDTGKYSKLPGWVYLWVLKDNKGKQSVCYVGKAGKTIKDRCNQHRNGARQSPSGSNKGRSNAKNIGDHLEKHKNNSIQIYARRSPDGSILDERVNLCEIEEKAMIEKCKKSFDLWNKL